MQTIPQMKSVSKYKLSNSDSRHIINLYLSNATLKLELVIDCFQTCIHQFNNEATLQTYLKTSRRLQFLLPKLANTIKEIHLKKNISQTLTLGSASYNGYGTTFGTLIQNKSSQR